MRKAMSTDDQSNPRGVQRDRPQRVDALASTVISVLRHRQAVSVEGLRQFILDYLDRAILSPSYFDAAAIADEMRGHRLSSDDLIDLYVPAAARLLGEKWVDNSINFADVTIGTMRLQSLLSEASAQMAPAGQLGQIDLQTLVIVPQGEQHFLGASVVAAQSRRLGCSVGMSFDEDLGSLRNRVFQEQPDLVMISCSRLELLESVAGTVQSVNDASKNNPVIALGGAFQMDTEPVKDLLGVDIVTSVVSEAVTFCTRRSQLKKKK